MSDTCRYLWAHHTSRERKRERERDGRERIFLSIPPDFDLFICFLLTKKIRNGVRTLHSKSLQEGKQKALKELEKLKSYEEKQNPVENNFSSGLEKFKIDKTKEN